MAERCVSEGVIEVFDGGWELRVVSDEEKDFVGVNPTCCDECVEKIGNCV